MTSSAGLVEVSRGDYVPNSKWFRDRKLQGGAVAVTAGDDGGIPTIVTSDPAPTASDVADTGDRGAVGV